MQINRKMILISLAAGSITALAQHGIAKFIESRQIAAEPSVQELLLSDNPPGGYPVQPLEQYSSQAGEPLSPGALPADAEHGPGNVAEPGSARPQIRVKQGWDLRNLIPGGSQRPSASLRLVKSSEVVKATKDPIWRLELVTSDGKVLDSLPALSGRVSRQSLDRHQAGNKSPLPKGVYSIDRYGIARAPFPDPELGSGYWVPITPLFNTGRSALGFHQDPSWGKTNGESGTSGCIGLESPDATIKLLDWIRSFNVSKLTVVS